MQQVILMVHQRAHIAHSKIKLQESTKLVEDFDVDKLH
jgi:hypothetical protein